MVLETIQEVHDTLSVAVEKSEDTGWILHHILDSKEIFGLFSLPEIHLFGIDLSITNHVVFMWLALIILGLTFAKVSKSYKKSMVPKGLTNFMEILIVFVRDEIVKPTIGKGYEKFLPYLLTVFFFILTLFYFLSVLSSFLIL